MPTLRRKIAKTTEVRKPYGVYEGPEPPPGIYPARIVGATLRTFSTGTQAINIGVVIEAAAESRNAQYNGAGTYWARLFLGEHDAQIAREAAFYQAITGDQANSAVNYETEKKRSGQGQKQTTDQKITDVGGYKVTGALVYVEIKRGDEYNGERRLEGDSIYAHPDWAPITTDGSDPAVADGADPDADVEPTSPPAKKAAAAPAQRDPEPEVDVTPASSGATEDVGDYHAFTLPKIKELARQHGIDPAQPKPKLLEALDQVLSGAAGGSTELHEGMAAADAEGYELTEIVTWAEREFYTKGDLDGMSKQEVIEMLVDEKFLLAF